MKEKEKIKEKNFETYILSILLGLGLRFFNLDDPVWLGLDLGTLLLGLGSTMFIYETIASINPYKKLFEGCNLEIDGNVPRLIKKKKANYGYDLILTLPYGLSSKQFEQKRTELEEHLGGRIEIGVKNRRLILQVYTKQLESYYEYKYIQTKGICEFPIGYTHGNKLVTVDLEKVVHLLIAGETGSGKSTLLRGIITSLILSNKNISLYLVDLKNGTEFNVFRRSKSVKAFCRNVEEAEELLQELSNEVDKRYDLFYQNDVVNIQEYNKLKHVKKLDYKILIIDEFADLQNEKNSISILETLAAKARACGIHMIIATQRPDSKIINGRIKANIPGVIGLKTLNDLNSRIIIDEGGLEKLRGRGHGILKYSDTTEFQSMFLTVQQARELIKHTYRKEEIKAKTESKSKIKAGEVKDFEFLKLLVGGKK